MFFTNFCVSLFAFAGKQCEHLMCNEHFQAFLSCCLHLSRFLFDVRLRNLEFDAMSEWLRAFFCWQTFCQAPKKMFVQWQSSSCPPPTADFLHNGSRVASVPCRSLHLDLFWWALHCCFVFVSFHLPTGSLTAWTQLLPVHLESTVW